MALIFFISHSHKDERIANALVRFLCSGVGVERNEIRCTSNLGAGLSSGAHIAETLRTDIKRCHYFLPLITRNSVSSEFVGFEIGAAWAFDEAEILPLTYLTDSDVAIPSLLKPLLCRDVSRQDHLVEFAQDLTSRIFVKKDQRNASEILSAANAFLAEISFAP